MSENIYTDESEHKLALRHLVKEDYADLKVMMDEVYPELGGAWPEKQFRAQLAVFPEGKFALKIMANMDLDLTKLEQLKNEGSVKNYLDRRRDLYKITWLGD